METDTNTKQPVTLSEKHIQNSLLSIQICIWSPVFLAVSLLFLSEESLAPIPYLAVGPLAGFIWFKLNVKYWKSENSLWSAICFIYLILHYRVIERTFFPDIKIDHSLQYFFILSLTQSLILKLQKEKLVRYFET